MWVGLTAIAGLISGSLVWYLPPGNHYLLLAAGVLSSIFTIGEVMAGGHRSLVYAAVISQTTMVGLAAAFHAHQPVAVLVCLLIAAPVLYFGLQMNQAMVREIEQRLLSAELAAELASRQQTLLRAQHQQSVLQERERVMQDMHDGLGASLSSSLLLLERGELTVEGAAVVMRECVDDLRLVVDSLEPASQDMATLLGMLRYRLQRRIGAAGVALRWDMDDLPTLEWLDPSLALDLLRLVQEAIANALNHARATELQLAARPAGEEVELLIRDNGRGFAGMPRAGRGLRTMEARAQRLGGRLTIQSTLDAGTTITLHLPKVRAASGGARHANC
jgi:signal transduction histidine kinase